MLKRLFTAHPRSVGESYGEHFSVASWYGLRLLGASLACLVHALLPFLFVRTGSATIAHLHAHMTGRLGPASDRQPHDAIPTATVAGAPVSDG